MFIWHQRTFSFNQTSVNQKRLNLYIRNPSKVLRKLPIKHHISDKDKFTDNIRTSKLADKGGEAQQTVTKT